MAPENIPVVVVSYNAPDILEILLRSFRQFYQNKIYVIDGSSDAFSTPIRQVASAVEGVELISFGYNIHHGPGMAWAIRNLPINGKVLFLDSDVEVLAAGFIESLDSYLAPGMYGVGNVLSVNRSGLNRPDEAQVAYLHPSCMLCNMEVMRQWPLPIKHGAPMLQTMLTLQEAGASLLIRHVEWVKNDNTSGANRIYIKHDWQGTVQRTGGYHYEAPSDLRYNRDLLSCIPANAKKIIEVGCNTGALARAYRSTNPLCRYLGIEINAAALSEARAHCDFVWDLNIEQVADEFLEAERDCDCWIFGDVLEHLIDPWAVLERIRKVMPEHAVLLACIPNVQHWSVQARISVGNFVYEPYGLLDKTHLRWFTRKTITQMFEGAGYRINALMPRIFEDPAREKFMPLIHAMAQAAGDDPAIACQDALALQYIVHAHAMR
ncbi:bifunctional glycosyltransferase/class I SAM-dependent methyltransferase [Rhodoferax saidenbachensis]|uniref:Uncharacterized protein n=1 Tax=Rhodoferax saidenbachensis TaxID=1484693 RepID=A0A1P8K6F9_9BURK|nr:bifunctional glycosyltransferase/class I SAM-dependent methyltransferase [Rhodoferax saidenbachensis]APW41602.1 hypothetical protein RS694_02885 [Rhodoferax saidenbachensis]